MAQIIPIADIHAPELDMYARLNEAQLKHYYEPDPDGIFIAESPIVIGRAMDAGYEPISMLMETKHVDTQAKEIIARAGDIPVYTEEFSVLTSITGFQLARGTLCAMRRRPRPTVDEVLQGARRVAVLENVTNPTNVGAIFRSAAALSMDAVLVASACADPLYRRAVRVSMGTVFQIPWTILDTELADIDKLKSAGFTTAAMALRDESISVRDQRLAHTDKLAVVLGAEGEGLSQTTIDACDYTVLIPMDHDVDSLNVAAASAVAFYAVCPQ